MSTRDVEPCSLVQESLSATCDGEAAPVSTARVDAHLAGCDACRRYATDLSALGRRAVVAGAEPVPNLTAPIMAALTDLDGRARRVRDLRVIVALAGLAQLVLAVPLLTGVAGPGVHLGRDLAALQLALGAGLLYGALRPTRTAGLLPVLAVVVAATVVTAVIDVLGGAASLAAELTHLSELAGLAALWALRRQLPDPFGAGRVGVEPA